MTRTKLKGGSLSGTFLIEDDDKKLFVRKEVSLVENREYGFQRWYSQLKKMQRYSKIFPGLFPDILSFRIDENDSKIAYFDMEYKEDTVNAHEWLMCTDDLEKIKIFSDSLIQHMKMIHEQEMVSDPAAIELYIREEISMRLQDSVIGDEISNYHELIFNGVHVKPFMSQLDDYIRIFKKYYTSKTEVFTHGNITLENLLYDEESNMFFFLDPYEENIVDSKLAEYSQILQSSSSNYEIYMNGITMIEGNVINQTITHSPGVDAFNLFFNDHLREVLSQEDFVVVKMFEISQFIRMLPFKKVVDKSKMMLFYAIASKLFQDFRTEYGE